MPSGEFRDHICTRPTILPWVCMMTSCTLCVKDQPKKGIRREGCRAELSRFAMFAGGSGFLQGSVRSCEQMKLNVSWQQNGLQARAKSRLLVMQDIARHGVRHTCTSSGRAMCNGTVTVMHLITMHLDRLHSVPFAVCLHLRR